MQLQIPISVFNNDFYSINGVNAINVNISYMDFQYSTTTCTTTIPTGNGSYPITVSPNVFTKSIQLDYLDISFNPYSRNSDIENMKLLFDNIRVELNKSYFKRLTDLGEKHRITAPMNSFDINMRDIKLKCKLEKKSVSRNIISKLMMASNYIAAIGRFGPAQWILSNSNTYKYILENIESDDLTFSNNIMTFGNIPYVVNDLIDDDIMLLGRKNDSTSPGLHCFILTDKNNNIHISEIINSYDYQKTYRIYYKIEEIGINPEYNFLKLNPRTLSYYRAKKLKRIKEVYGV